MRMNNIKMVTRVSRAKLLETLKANLAEHAAIVAEARRGYVEKPSVNVRQKAGLFRELSARCFFEFRRQLAYKCGWYGSEYREVEPAFTSQRCHGCGYVAAENRKSQAAFCCVACGHEANADVNAALNIRDAKPIVENKSGGARRAGAGRRRREAGQGTVNPPAQQGEDLHS